MHHIGTDKTRQSCSCIYNQTSILSLIKYVVCVGIILINSKMELDVTSQMSHEKLRFIYILSCFPESLLFCFGSDLM